MTDEDLGLRERKRRETRLALNHAAIRLCMQRGWDNVTVDDIAEAAHVSPRTFRNYFSNKAEAVAAGHLERMLRIADSLRVRPASEALWTAIGNAAAEQFEAPERPSQEVARWKQRIRFIFTEPAIHAEVLKASDSAHGELAAAIAERTGASNADRLHPQLSAAVVIAVIGNVMGHWLKDGPAGPIVPRLKQAFDLIASGLPYKTGH